NFPNDIFTFVIIQTPTAFKRICDVSSFNRTALWGFQFVTEHIANPKKNAITPLLLLRSTMDSTPKPGTTTYSPPPPASCVLLSAYFSKIVPVAFGGLFGRSG